MVIATFRRTHPLLFRFFLWIGLPLISFLLLAYVYFSRSLPMEHGSIRLAGLSDTVRIVNDEYGVPHIFAQTDRDAWFALGYLHAQNRLWQMESQRRLGQGRLSELLGRSLLQNDQFMRTLGLYRVAKNNFKYLGPTARRSLEAYAGGVNAWLAQDHVLPIEFQVLGFRPEPWQAHDSLLQIKLIALSLDRNYRDDLTFSLLTKTLGAQRANQIRAGYPQQSAVVTQAQTELSPAHLSALLTLNDRIDDMFRLAGEGAGSNAWVVAGQYTQSGKPLLANDPHMKTQMPSIWYLAEIHGDKLHVAGGTIPGLPLVLAGHNESIAWGMTALYADTQDIFLERKQVANDNLYEVDGRWVPVQVEEQWINVRADFPAFLNKPPAPVRWPVRSTHHGPLISDALGEIDSPMALKWCALKDDDTSYAAFLAINYAQDWPAFRAALEHHTSPTLNFIYADRQGNIGYAAGGEVPLRGSGDGSLPVPGWTSRFDWIGTIPRADLPHSLNPASGYIVTANNKIHGEGYPYFISRDWAPAYRADRITDLIAGEIRAGRKLTVESFVRMQGDEMNLQAGQLRQFFASVAAVTARQKQAVGYLRNWDLQTDEESVAASIYHAWLRHFSRSILEDALQADALHEYRRVDRKLYDEIYPVFLNEVVNGSMPEWCDMPGTPGMESCSTRALVSLDSAMKDLTLIGGTDMRKWQWGRLHRAYYPHGLFTKVKLLDRIFDRSIAQGGDAYTVDVAPAVFSKDKGYQALAGASYRQVVDLGDWRRSRFLNNTGQSGNIFSSHYDDYLLRHKGLRPVPMSFGERDTRGGTLLLEPADKSHSDF